MAGKKTNFYLKESVVADLSGFVERLQQIDPAIKHNIVITAALALFYEQNDDRQLKLIGRARNYDLARNGAERAEAANRAVDESLEIAAGQGRQEKARPAGEAAP